MNHIQQFRQLLPGIILSDNFNDDPTVIPLSKWPLDRQSELLERVKEIFEKANERTPIPTVLILYDCGYLNRDREQLVNDLTEAGGIPCIPNTDEGSEAIRQDPLTFVRTQLAAIQQGPIASVAVPSISTLAPSVTKPDGYKEFATAVNPLTADTLQEVIEGRRTDDWRYTI